MAGLRDLARAYGDVRFYAISRDLQGENRELARKIAFDGRGAVWFSLLSDPRSEVVDRYGLRDPAYAGIGKRLEEIESARSVEHRNRMFYLAVPPSVFTTIVQHLSTSGLAPRTGHDTVRPWVRIVIEKPFGHSLDTAMTLNSLVLSCALRAFASIWRALASSGRIVRRFRRPGRRLRASAGAAPAASRR